MSDETPAARPRPRPSPRPEQRSPSPPGSPTRSRARSPLFVLAALAGIVVVLLGITVVVGLVLAQQVHGTSMSPTLHDGDRIIVTPGTDGHAGRFDVVSADDPTRSGAELVKRVIGLPGDAVQIRGGAPAQYEVLVRPGNTGPWFRVAEPTWTGQWLNRTTCCAANGAKSQDPTARVVPAGSYFVMGDNPDVSIDSRAFGWIRGSAINGRLGLRIWPLSAGRGIGNRPHLVPSG